MFALVDASSDGVSPHPYLTFDAGVIVIADDFETINDKAAREFTISKQDAIGLAIALLLYSQQGSP